MAAKKAPPTPSPTLRAVFVRVRSLWVWTGTGILACLLLRADLLAPVDRLGVPSDAFGRGPWFLEAFRLSAVLVVLLAGAHLRFRRGVFPPVYPADSAARALSELASVLILAVGLSPLLRALARGTGSKSSLLYALWGGAAALLAARALLRLQKNRQGVVDLARGLAGYDRWRQWASQLRGTVKCSSCGGENVRGEGGCEYCGNPLPLISPSPPAPPS